MKRVTSVIWGVILIVAGALFALNALGITNIDVFFDGWWTLFIIIPCTIGLITDSDKVGNAIGVAVGVFLLLCCQDILGFDMLWKLAVPVIIVIIGIKMVFGSIFQNKAPKIIDELRTKGNQLKSGCAIFSGQNLNFEGESFEGAELTAVFGGVKCDLRNAVITKDCAIQAEAIFGGVTIFVPDNINVKVNSISLFGGVTNKTKTKKDAVTLHISGTCIFGGVDIK